MNWRKLSNVHRRRRVRHQDQLHKNQKIRKIKNADFVAKKILLKKKKPEEKKAKLLTELETNNLHMKCINSNINKNKNNTQHVRGKSIQLPFGVVRDKTKKKSIKLNLPPDLRKDVLFDHLPYLRHLEIQL